MRVLLLGGTGEASALAARLADDRRFDTTLSLAGATQTPTLPPIAHRIGGFGGVQGLCRWLQGEAVQAVIDATHPYAVQMSTYAARACEATGVRLLRIARPAWVAGPEDRWLNVSDAEAAAMALGRAPRRVLLTLGSRGLPAFHAAPWHHYVIRCIDAPDRALLPPLCELLLARGPFTLADERALLATHRIELLVTKNSGGPATAAKLQAARERGLGVIMIGRPATEPGVDAVTTAAAAMDWLAGLHQRLERGA